MSQNSHSGYLVIADISGYTSYVAQTELEHSQEVLAELLELIVGRIQPLLTVVRLEGDAVFSHAPKDQIPRGESLAEVLEATYTAFRDHVRGIVQRTTCECDACRRIPMLDLKFIVHYGDYIMQQVTGIRELVGTEVNRLFRLAKNHVTEETGWNAYILYTEASLEQSGIPAEGMHKGTETHEHLGEVTTYTMDLHARFEEIAAARHVVLSPEEAHGVFTYDFAAPPAIVWEWLNDPFRRNQVTPQNSWSAIARPGGRSGVGASNHCAHGKNGLSCETILDWRPFEYVTSRHTNNKMPEKLFDMMQTIRLEPVKEGAETRVEWRAKLDRVPGFMAKRMLSNFFKMYRNDYIEPLNRIMLEEYERTVSPADEPSEEIAVAAGAA